MIINKKQTMKRETEIGLREILCSGNHLESKIKLIEALFSSPPLTKESTESITEFIYVTANQDVDWYDEENNINYFREESVIDLLREYGPLPTENKEQKPSAEEGKTDDYLKSVQHMAKQYDFETFKHYFRLPSEIGPPINPEDIFREKKGPES